MQPIIRGSVRIDGHLRAVHRRVAGGRRGYWRERRDVLGARKAPRLAQAHLACLDLARRGDLPSRTRARPKSPRGLLIKSAIVRNCELVINWSSS